MPLTPMTELKTFNIIQSNLNKIVHNIKVVGVENTMMKVGQAYQYQQSPSKKKKKSISLSDGEESKVEDKLPSNRGLRGRTAVSQLESARVLTEGNDTDRTQSGGSKDGSCTNERRQNPGVLDDMDEEFEALDKKKLAL